MSNNDYRIRKTQSINIQKQLGGYVGAISKISKNFPKSNFQHDKYSLGKNCYNICNLFINSKVICVLIGLMTYIFIGGIIFQILEKDLEKEKFINYTQFLQEIKYNLTDEQYNNLFVIGDLTTPKERYLFWDDWQESVFFAFTLVSTIGYGKFTPITTNGKIFSMFYILFGVPIGAYSFGFFASFTLNVINLVFLIRSDPIGRAYKLLGLEKGSDLTPNQTKRIINKLENNLTEKEIEEVIDDADVDGDGTISYDELKKIVYVKNWNMLKITQTCQQFIYVLILIIMYLLIGTFTFSSGESWSLLDSLYFCVITITTIGLGDLYPINNKMLVFMFSCIGLGLVALLVSFLCEIISKHSNISSLKKMIKYGSIKNNLLNVDHFIDWLNEDNIHLYHNGNVVWAIRLHEKFNIQLGNHIHYGKKDEWLLVWKNGKMYVMSDNDFKIIYEKVRKRDNRDSLYRLRIRLLAYNCNNHHFNMVELRDHGKKGEKILLNDGKYVVYDIITDTIFLASKFQFEKDYKIENRVRIEYEKLKKARILIDNIRLSGHESNNFEINYSELEDEIIV